MILVTGGAGFIGSNLLAALEARGEHELALSDRFGSDGKWRNVAKREIAENVPPDRLFDFLEANAVEVIFHMGASSSTTETDVDFTLDNNFTLSLGLWKWCADHGARLIYASSAATYGDGAEGFTDDATVEGLARLRPLNPYGWSKHLFDRRVARLMANDVPRPAQCVGLKFFNAYGPNEYHKGEQRSVVAKNFARVAAGEAVKLFKSHHPDYPDGGQRRDFVWVEDCVEVMLWFLDHRETNGLFNVGTGKAETFRDLVEAMFEAAGREPKIEYIDMPEDLRAHYQYFTQAELTKLRDAGYDKPFAAVKEGVGSYMKDYLLRPDPYR